MIIFFFCFFHAGVTVYNKALTRAFDLFKGTSAESSSSRKKVILFLTDGEPTDRPLKSIIQTIRTKNAELNNEVVIMTYGMLQYFPILRDIAHQSGHGFTRAPDVTVSFHKSGIYDLANASAHITQITLTLD